MAVRTDGVSRRAQIIDVAARLFEQHGYHETTMEMLAQEVGVKKASLYYYFSSKDLILVDIHEEMIDHLLEAARVRSQAAGPAERLRGVITDLVSLMELFPGRLRIFFEHYRELPAAQRTGILVKRDEYHGVLVAALRDGSAEGLFDVPDVELAALAVLGMCNWTYQWLRPGGALTAAEVADHFYGLLLGGIATPALQRTRAGAAGDPVS